MSEDTKYLSITKFTELCKELKSSDKFKEYVHPTDAVLNNYVTTQKKNSTKNDIEHDPVVRNFVYCLIKFDNFQAYFFNMKKNMKIHFLMTILGLNYDEAELLSRVDRDKLLSIKIGRPPGCHMNSVEFTILSI